MKKKQLPISLEEFKKKRKPYKDILKEFNTNQKLSLLDRAAVYICDNVGTMGFFLLILIWSIIWLLWNIFAPKEWQFDPAPAFVAWLFISNLIQILLMPLLLVGQNIQGKKSEARAEHDLEVNVKAEKEIEVILEHLEYQNDILLKMLEKVGGDVNQLKHQPKYIPKKNKK